MRRMILTKKYIWLAIIALIVVAMLIDLNTRISALTFLTEQKRILESDVTNLQTTLEVVNDRLNYARSDTAVEEWARKQGLMMMPDDFILLPLPDGEVTPTPQIIPTVVRTQPQNWEIWKSLIFD